MSAAFGIISMNYETENDYITGMASFADKHGFEIYRFTPNSIVPKKETVVGLKFSSAKKEWIEAEFPIPSILYDRCFYRDDEELNKFSPIINWLKSRKDLLFLGYGLPNKWLVYETLKSNPQIEPYLIQTKQAKKISDVIKMLQERRSVLLKPTFGSQGKGIFVIQNRAKNFAVLTVKNQSLIEKTMDAAMLKKWLQMILTKYHYMVQPFLSLFDEQFQPFDIRILLQKDENGLWIERGKGMRVGMKNSIISNIAGGGVPALFEEWLQSLRKEKRQFIVSELNDLIHMIPGILESNFQSLFEIGIDVGIDQNGAIWLLEVNSKPGRNVILELHPELAEAMYEAPIKYGKYLLNLHLKGAKNS